MCVCARVCECVMVDFLIISENATYVFFRSFLLNVSTPSIRIVDCRMIPESKKTGNKLCNYIIILSCLFSSKPKVKLTSEVMDASKNRITNLNQKKKHLLPKS